MILAFVTLEFWYIAPVGFPHSADVWVVVSARGEACKLAVERAVCHL